VSNSSFDDVLEYSQVEIDGFGSVRPERESDGVGAVVVEDSFRDGEDELEKREVERRVREEERSSGRSERRLT